MNKVKKLVILMLMTFVFGCSGIQVSQDYDLSTDYYGLKTYDWAPTTQQNKDDTWVNNSLLENRIHTAVDRSLSDKGYQRVSQGTADFYVGYQYRIRRKIQSDNLSTGIGFGIGSYSRRGGIGVSTGTGITEYDQGILIIDIIDATNDNLMWRGTGTSRVSQHSSPENKTKNINETVEKILEQFPP